MRCKILCFKSDCYDINAISNQLSKDRYSVNADIVNSVDGIEHLLQQNNFDLFLIADEDAKLLEAAKLIKRMILPYKLSTLFIAKSKDENIKLQLAEYGAANVLLSEASNEIIANMIDLILQRDRYKSELASMGSYMRDASLVFDPDGESYRINFANKAFLDIDGSKQEDMVGKLVEDTHSYFNLSLFLNDIKEVDATGIPAHMPNYFYMKDAVREWSDVYIYKPNSEQVSLIASPQTEIKRTQDRAEASRRYLQTILNAQAHIIYITDGNRLININKAFLDFFGFATMHDFVKEHTCTSELFEPSELPGYIDGNSKDWINEVAMHPQEIYKIRIKKDDAVTVFVPTVQVVVIDGKKQHVVILTDITELEFEKEKLRIVAMTDQLTGAANRFKFNTVIEEQVAVSRRYQSDLSMIIFDVDDFKALNDRYTHQVGDAVLKMMASITHKAVRESDLFVRWDGAEFMIILPNTSLAHAALVAEKIRHAFESYEYEGAGHVTCSFGCTALKEDDTVSEMISRADEAMYQAKKAGRNCVKVSQ